MNKFTKLLACSVLAGMMMFNLAEAKEVTVDGFGMDRESALKDARRNAVEQVIGTFVDSRTLTNNSIVELDQVYLKSSGFIGKVDILSEGMENGLYKVRATINVDQNPNPELLAQVQAVVALNDPRIAVAVFKENTSAHEEAIESAIINKLIAMNFSHVVGTTGSAAEVSARRDVDFVILANTHTTSNNIRVPDFKGGYKDLNLNRSKTDIITKIVRLDTGAVLETFTLETSGIDSRAGEAENISLKNMAEQAAAKVDEKFRRIGAKSNLDL